MLDCHSSVAPPVLVVQEVFQSVLSSEREGDGKGAVVDYFILGLVMLSQVAYWSWSWSLSCVGLRSFSLLVSCTAVLLGMHAAAAVRARSCCPPFVRCMSCCCHDIQTANSLPADEAQCDARRLRPKHSAAATPTPP